MDVAYDHTFQAQVAPATETTSEKGKEPERQEESLNEEFRQAYQAISASPWGARFGAFVGNVRKQGESVLETSKKEYSTVTEQATKGFGDITSAIVTRTRGLSLSGALARPATAIYDPAGAESSAAGAEHQEGLLEKIRKNATLRIQEIEAAEARADEYLAKFGSNIGSFLRDAVTIAPPEQDSDSKEVLFEAKGAGENRQIYTTRLDAQLHLLHSNLELFKKDPEAEKFRGFEKGFSVDQKTEVIAADLERYPELRATMEKAVPDEVQYAAFWTRYYFFREELDRDEQKRKELLKGANLDEEEVGWDEGSDDEEDEDDEDEDDEEEDEDENDDDETASAKHPKKVPAVKASTDTLQAKPRTSTDKTSQPDSEASYDLVSGAPSKATSQAPNSPPKPKGDDSDEEDWE